MDLTQRKQWQQQRFGEIDDATLGRLDALNQMVWPDIEHV